MFCVIAKNSQGKWILNLESDSFEEANMYCERFKESMYLLKIQECRVISKDEIKNISDIRWQQDINFRCNVHTVVDITISW